MPAELHQIVHAGIAAIGPVLDVVSIDISGVGTARKTTAFVSGVQ